ncbi:element excision factor XisI family protein [Leptolyngbya sp. NIES-2104]|uniref:element excision factor XisI family protein n=1 Tax=Leptolyngbya sp. NIES-2104 TaxID=1552121 RepID=UPI0006ECA4EF|nr:element excision factor XisI family protein [Leptolyngbya sp. NIES-2104]GAP99981.1 putative two-component system sensor kinase [Leptolyngbya sp. NIES-2104]
MSRDSASLLDIFKAAEQVLQFAEGLTLQPQQTQACITRAQELAKQGLSEARRSVWLLYHTDSAANSLPDAIARLIEQMTTGTTVQIALNVEGMPYYLDAPISLNLLRIAQESLTNALRHANAQTVQINLSYAPEQVQISVRDNGCGFDPQTIRPGLGLTGIRDRDDSDRRSQARHCQTIESFTHSMDTRSVLDQYQQALNPILQSYCEILNRANDGTTSKVIVSDNHTRYLIITEGWSGKKRIHALVFDAEIRGDKLWLHHDGLDHGITPELVAAEIPKSSIVLAFHPPHVREHTEYALS